MRRFRSIFVRWFLALMLFFVLANLTGLVRHMGLKPIHYVGFPFICAAWGMGVEKVFRWWALGFNALIALTVSGLLALVCSAWRCWRVPAQERAPSDCESS